MPDDRAVLVDRLKRALDMEEAMVNQIVALMQPDALPAALLPAHRDRIREGLLTVRDDSRRHAKMVGEMIRALSKGAP